MTLWMYLTRRFYTLFAMVSLVFMGLLYPLDVMEQLRKLGGTDTDFRDGLLLAALNMPAALYQILPLIIILSAIGLFLGLARSSEMLVIRAAGRSALRALIAPATGALILGLLGLLLLNPLVAATQKAYEERLAESRPGLVGVVSISSEGLWLRQGDATGQTVIRAARSSLDGTVLYDVTFMTFDLEGRPVSRIDARRARLVPEKWTIFGAKIWPLGQSLNPERDAKKETRIDLPSSLTIEQIRDSFGVPSAIPILALPNFIRTLDDAGFSALSHRAWLASELASPLFLVAMVLISASFTLRHQRGGRVGFAVLGALLVGFGLFFLKNFAQVMGENGQLPIWLAAAAPPLAGIAFALGVLLHWEDG